MSYVRSGRFLSDLEDLLGTKLPRTAPADEADDDDDDAIDPLADFPAELRSELEALRAVLNLDAVPKLCVLTPGDFCSVPALTDEERDVVLEDWFDGDEVATDFVMKAVDIINGGGGFYVLVAADGRMGLVCEDPYSFDPLECNLESFLRALVAAHRAVCERGVAAGKQVLAAVVDEHTAKLLLTFAGRLAPKSK